MILAIFDVDGTLVYSEGHDSATFGIVYRQHFGNEFPSIDWNTYPHVTDHTIFNTVFLEQFGRTPSAHEVVDFQQAFVDQLQRNRVATPELFRQVKGANTLFEKLHAQGISVGLATGGWMRPAKLKLEYVGIPLTNVFDAYADDKHTRPDIINTVLTAVRQTGQTPQRVVYFGDADWDVKTTREMKMPLVGVRWRGDYSALGDQGVSHVIADYDDFDEIIEAIHQAEIPRNV